MKAIHPIAKGKAEIELQRIEKFKIEFVNTPAYEDLNTQFPIFEIFEMNNGKFEIETVQQAFESWLNNLKPQKRHCFIKDLDKLMSGDYVLVPKEPTPEMERAGMAAGAGFGAIQIFKTMCAVAQGKSI
ncbi:hypothetical protein [Acinetobacter venetianus]|uniref:hypothetical protein n=1 Tax=Acinetobacter venetianus TaxID=52133 RepID=UPI000794236D|nr:hypothetical protein [Acinetobacter venetianus]KXZ66844.1 hypothetical protein AVENLUH7437_00658 [Acinetobacter venetianus]